jgi:hypothetical protein
VYGFILQSSKLLLKLLYNESVVHFFENHACSYVFFKYYAYLRYL